MSGKQHTEQAEQGKIRWKKNVIEVMAQGASNAG